MTGGAVRIPKDLQTTFVDRHLALGLGAGVSQASKLPEWNELVCRLAERFPHVGRQSAEALLAAGYDATVLATILRASAPGKKEFAELVRQALYRDFPFHLPVGKETHTQFVAHIRETNPTLHAVGTFCGVRETQRTFLPNPRVRAVLTLNLDALLEMYTRARFRKRVLRTVERAAADASSSRIHSYHLHGFLVRDFTSATRRKEAVESADRLILTEQQYFDVVADAHGFVNYTLLYLLREYRFLFIGLSMRDPNLRRALHLSFKERIRELLAEGETKETARARALRHWAIMKKNTSELDSATTVLLEVIGVKPLWITEWADIPALLKALYESPGENTWDDAA